MQTVQHVMTHVRPEGPTPLTQQLAQLQQYIASIAPQLRQQNQTVTVVIATQGTPTLDGGGGNNPGQQFVQTLKALEALPVWVVFRLCTDDERVFDFYNSLDSSISLPFDCLDDFFGESLEVYLRNPWLTYGLPLHRFRELGFRVDVLDAIDERALTLSEVRDLCYLLFATQPLPDPAVNWDAFMQAVSSLVAREKQQWNPVTRKVSPWINLHDLNRLYGGVARGHAAPQPHPMMQQGYPTQQQHQSQQYQQQRPPPPTPQQYPPYTTQTPSHNAPAQQPPMRPSTSQMPSHSAPPQRPMQHSVPHPPASDSQPTSVPEAPNNGTGSDIAAVKTSVMTKWALQPPNFQAPRPIAYLLGTLHTTFPPANGIEPHEYFNKWKPFSVEALSSGQTAVIKRAVRKTKFFLHPDKLPRDFSEKQTFLCKTLWDVTADAWEAAPKD